MKIVILKFLTLLMFFGAVNLYANTQETATVENSTYKEETYKSKPFSEMMSGFLASTGINAFLNPDPNEMNAHGEWMSDFHKSWGRLIMILVTFLLFYLAIKKGFEPLLLLPIAFGGLLANIPVANIAGEHGFLGVIYNMGLANEMFPIIIFMGVGAMTDFGPLLSNPKTALLGGAAQFGIFGTLVGAVALSQYTDIFNFTIQQASAISIIGGADGPTSIFIATKLAPELLGAIAVASYSYMAMVPIIQPPIMKALTNDAERRIKMTTLRHVSRLEKLVFPIMVLSLAILILPESTPLIGAFMFGNFLKESGVVERLNDTLQNSLINTVTIFLGLGVGSKLAADQFLVADTLAILALGVVAFSVGTAAGVIMAKIMNLFPGNKINPLIGSAGVSAVPMAARVSNKVGMEYDRSNMLLMHAMGPNVAGVIGSAVAAGVLISLFQ
ncbi:MAG: sodium ion-translocating decarboxylase subunit beta [Epsilonproteobacteria bacterium]|nr:sodium ion-translocating decarboxylase subunit beta [Campylobacterota bacterium]OIO17204.1 MAG: glutaconyl-CoA decarboxylase subunit beta [Helicobacteraceae bacterium CG1_02_36_14]PIP11119.1 MAG: glutaconyl-CoA decarboxylase subunit beta [Sulfurimonas sp. CG23_combo_of_CG06-09_8_20_14_all_36_33]PIS24854.1 MAG: sodium ion-translocating decarboxylase subunit beta [Sulfurimonas sp. CG08_land_8_20_14_0_20_36_33]PIU34560.1 MAG: sodium ion-translocating decarboxylase subunit beta [Sulfurimonas sp.